MALIPNVELKCTELTSRGEVLFHSYENFLILFKGTMLSVHFVLTETSNLQSHCMARTGGTKQNSCRFETSGFTVDHISFVLGDRLVLGEVDYNP